MTERMTDEQIAEIERRCNIGGTTSIVAYWDVVLRALRAERERADAAEKKLETCTTCGGDGLMDVVVDVLPPDEHEVLAAEECGECHGTGQSSWGVALTRAEAAEAALAEARESSEAWRKRWEGVASALRDFLKTQPTHPKIVETIRALTAELEALKGVPRG